MCFQTSFSIPQYTEEIPDCLLKDMIGSEGRLTVTASLVTCFVQFFVDPNQESGERNSRETEFIDWDNHYVVVVPVLASEICANEVILEGRSVHY